MTERSSPVLLAVLIGAAFMLAGGETVHACSCMGPNPPCQAVWQAGAVFTGEIVSVTDVDRMFEGPPPVVARGRRARVRVLEWFRGTQSAEVDVFTGAGGGDCGFGFIQGGRYLIYAYREPGGRLSTGICTRTALVAKATEDLEYLRGPARDPAVFGRIFGRAERQVPSASDEPEQQSPYQGARITVTGGDRSYRATTAADGRYEVRVPPGEYQVSAEVADGWYAAVGFSKAVVLDTRGCVQSDVFVRPDGRVSGRVVDADGRAVQGLLIDLAQERQFQRPEVSPYFRLRTDGDGRFEFTHLPPGRYYLGSNLQQNPREALPVPLFYPGVPARTSAEVVALGLAEQRRLDDFVLPAFFEVVRVSGVVFLPDGRPAARIRVYTWLGEKGYNLLGEPVITNPDGRFSLLVSAGHLYRVSVEHLAANGNVSARVESQPFKASSDLTPLVLRLVPVKPPVR